MGLDIRLPMGILFSILGVLLMIFGVAGDRSIYVRSLGININLMWGCVMLAFGLLNLLLARRGAIAARTAAPPKQ
jgi:hypothetical protein